MGFALLIARCRPSVGRAVARLMADCLAAQRSSTLARSIRANQWIVRDKAPGRRELDELARRVLRHAARSLYDFYHNLDRPDGDRRLVSFDATIVGLLDRMRTSKEGVVVVAPHLSNFDLVVRAALRTGVRTQILTLNNGAPAYQAQDLLRRNPNLTVTPVSAHTLKTAVQRLKEGGSVVTGIDRPLHRSSYRPRFFGRSAALPVHHIYLALKTDTPVSVISAHSDANGTCRVGASDLIAMRRYPNRADDIVRNAEHILEIAADYIRQTPDQWSMFFPVWPDALEEMKGAGV